MTLHEKVNRISFTVKKLELQTTLYKELNDWERFKRADRLLKFYQSRLAHYERRYEDSLTPL